MKIYRVIDNGDCVLTTDKSIKALKVLNEILEKHDVTVAWCDEEEVK